MFTITLGTCDAPGVHHRPQSNRSGDKHQWDNQRRRWRERDSREHCSSRPARHLRRFWNNSVDLHVPIGYYRRMEQLLRYCYFQRFHAAAHRQQPGTDTELDDRGVYILGNRRVDLIPYPTRPVSLYLDGRSDHMQKFPMPSHDCHDHRIYLQQITKICFDVRSDDALSLDRFIISHLSRVCLQRQARRCN